MLNDGDGRKTPKYENEYENQGKNSPFSCPPIPHLPNGGRLFFGARKTPKTSWTYPKWERVPNIMGQKKDSVGCGMGS